jgi:hypothetical protein
VEPAAPVGPVIVLAAPVAPVGPTGPTMSPTFTQERGSVSLHTYRSPFAETIKASLIELPVVGRSKVLETVPRR